MDEILLKVAGGQAPADLVIINGQLVNVNSGEIYPGGVAVSGERIAATGDVAYAIGKETAVIDAGGKYIVPGFIDGHIHPESANLSMTRFAEVVLSHGTTSVVTDLHEIGVVGGVDAMQACLEEGRRTPLKFHWVVPSHIPFSPGLETSGGTINADVIQGIIGREDVTGLSEVVSAYVVIDHPDLMKSLDATRKAGKIVCGHCPETHGPAWNKIVAAGVTNDHEALTSEEILQRVRSGVNAQLRHNLIVPTLPEVIKAVTEHKVDTRLMSLCTDDTTAVILADEGHMDHLIRLSISLGVDFITAIQMATINAAQAFHKDFEIGSLAPGRYADINIVNGPENFTVLKTLASGKLVAEDNHQVEPAVLPEHNPILTNTFHLKTPVTAADLVFQAPEGAASVHVHVMRTLPWVPITTGEEADLPVCNGYIAADPEKDILPIAVVERHHATGNIGRAFLAGMGLKRGAMASSIGHDSHNIVTMGATPEDMAFAANRVAELQGGIVLAENGKVVAEIELPLLGLLSDLDAWTLAAKRKELLGKAAEMGCVVSDAFMFLSFITLAAIPAFSITDKGYVDVEKQALMNPVLSV